MADSYTSRTLQRVVEALDRPQMFLLDTLFPDVVTFDTETVEFDLIDKAMGIAPFVSPLVAGTMIQARGYETKSFRPAYVKPKSELDTTRPFRRRAGEQFNTPDTPQVRREIALLDLLEQQRDMIFRRKELMASEAVRTGRVTVAGEGFPTQVVDYRRDSSLTVALSGGTRWGEAGVRPLASLETWANTVSAISGAVASLVIMDPLAYALFAADPTVEKLLNPDLRQSAVSLDIAPALLGSGAWGRYKGQIGDLSIWTYSQPYTAENGTPSNMMPPHTVIMTAPSAGAGIDGIQCHGAIRDPRAGLRPLEIFTKTWIDEDPATEWVMSQSAPLLVPTRPNASFCATVR